MIILGIHDGHNATAALMRDGKFIAALAEERLCYKKNVMGFPLNAIRKCLAIGGIQPSDIDHVAFSTLNHPIHYLRIERYSFGMKDWLDEQEFYWKPLLHEGYLNEEYLKDVVDRRAVNEGPYDFTGLPIRMSPEQNQKELNRLRLEALDKFFSIGPDKVRYCDHHTCHQYYALHGSPIQSDRVAVLTMDGGGDGANATVAIMEDNKITEVARTNDANIGRIYRYITLQLGMKQSEHEFKVMGLAPYASDYEIKKTAPAFKDIFEINNMLPVLREKPKDLFFHFKDLLRDCRFDGIAGGVQQMTEEAGTMWVQAVMDELKVDQLVFSGGVSMNVKLNKRIAEMDCVSTFQCPASGGDESAALGACYYVHTHHGGEAPLATVEDNYLGNECSDEDIEQALATTDGYTIIRATSNEDVAKLLSRGIVLGRMCGRMEFGARALGNRSILTDPRNADMVRTINRKIKFRDFWMPFAPSILDTAAEKYLVNPKGVSSDHMTHSFDTTQEGRKALAATMHQADFTVRAHILRRKNNPGYYDLLEAFQKITGVGALLNTSFNLHGLPIVCTPEHALHVFENSDLDAMLLNTTLVLKPNAAEKLD